MTGPVVTNLAVAAGAEALHKRYCLLVRCPHQRPVEDARAVLEAAAPEILAAGRERTTAAGFDLDSTIANTEHRRHLMPHMTAGSTWDDYAAACPGDTPMEGVIAVMRALHPAHQIHIVSGRSGSAEAATRDWLAKHGVPYDVLHLRGPGDITSNGTAKAKYLIALREAGVEPVVFFEDWRPVAEIIREQAGVPVVLIDAGHGEYESAPHDGNPV